jgi:hypothetical protein
MGLFLVSFFGVVADAELKAAGPLPCHERCLVAEGAGRESRLVVKVACPSCARRDAGGHWDIRAARSRYVSLT